MVLLLLAGRTRGPKPVAAAGATASGFWAKKTTGHRGEEVWWSDYCGGTTLLLPSELWLRIAVMSSSGTAASTMRS